MDTYGNAQTGDIVWYCTTGYMTTIHWKGNHGWHMYGHGWETVYNTNDELHMDGNTCQNKKRMPSAVVTDNMNYINIFQIRVK